VNNQHDFFSGFVLVLPDPDEDTADDILDGIGIEETGDIVKSSSELQLLAGVNDPDPLVIVSRMIRDLEITSLLANS
jgi:hypothetical protein